MTMRDYVLKLFSYLLGGFLVINIFFVSKRRVEGYVRVTRVIDGDTIEIENRYRVRYIGIDTPEIQGSNPKERCLAKLALKQNKNLVLFKLVKLEKDKENKDRYGRLLRYVYLTDKTMVNLKLLQEGMGDPLIIYPNTRYAQLFKSAVKTAKKKRVGIWNPQICGSIGAAGLEPATSRTRTECAANCTTPRYPIELY